MSKATSAASNGVSNQPFSQSDRKISIVKSAARTNLFLGQCIRTFGFGYTQLFHLFLLFLDMLLIIPFLEIVAIMINMLPNLIGENLHHYCLLKDEWTRKYTTQNTELKPPNKSICFSVSPPWSKNFVIWCFPHQMGFKGSLKNWVLPWITHSEIQNFQDFFVCLVILFCFDFNLQDLSPWSHIDHFQV